MNNPEIPRSNIEQRRKELQELDPALIPAFWEGVERDTENNWWDRSGITREEYMQIVHGDENEKL